MSTLVQRSFSSGEIAPALYARVDTARYAAGLRTLRNMLVMRHGGAANRPGTVFVGEVKDSSKVVRMIPFVFNSSQTYVLEFGDLYLRVHKSGVQQTLTAQNITGITNASTAVVAYSGSDTYANGDEVVISGIVGPIGTYLNGRNFKVASVNTGANTFQLKYMDGTSVNSTSMGAYTSGGSLAEVYTLVTPYAATDLAELRFVQSADVITITHPSYAPRELSRTGDTSWAIAAVTFAPSINPPSAGLSGAAASKTVTGATKAVPCVVTAPSHGFSDGDGVMLTGVVGMTEINSVRFVVLQAALDTFQLHYTNNDNVDSTGYGAYVSGGQVSLIGTNTIAYVVTSIATGTGEESIGSSAITVSNAATPTPQNPIALSWTAVSGASQYNVYKGANGVYGFIGVTASNSFSDIGYTADMGNTAPQARNPFPGANDYPTAVGYFQQRLVMAGTNNKSETTYCSKSGQFKNFTISSPVQDDDAVTFSVVGSRVNRVQHLLDLGKFLIFTTGGVTAVAGDVAGTLTPTAINPKQFIYNGVSSLAPVVIGSDALYVQARGSRVRDLAYEVQVEGYRGNDLTIFSAHLVDGYTLVDWAYQEIPHSVVWAVRDDGILLGLTYIKEQQMVGWHRHDFDGTVENVCVVPEGTEDAVYLVIKRSVDGRTVRYIERMTQRRVDDIVDWIGMDATLSYDGRNSGSTSMTLSGGDTWDYNETMTLTASAPFFASSDVGNAIHLTGSDGTLIRFAIDHYTSTTVVTGKPHRSVPAAMQSVATTDWSKAVDEVSGLWHLEGKGVSVFADGFVVASPNNPAYPVQTVTNGAITLEKPYAVIHVGLPYISDLETLDVDTAQGQTIVDKKKLVGRVTAYVESTRGVWIGAAPPTDDSDDPLEGLEEYKARSDEGYNDPVALSTGAIDINIQPQWNSNGRVFIRQVDPLPLSVLSVAPAGLFALGGQ